MQLSHSTYHEMHAYHQPHTVECWPQSVGEDLEFAESLALSSSCCWPLSRLKVRSGSSVLSDKALQVRGVVMDIMAEVRAGPPVVAPELQVLRLELDLPGCFSPLCAPLHTCMPAQ